MAAPSTRRFEMGLPLFSGLDLGKIAEVQVRIQNRDITGLSDFVKIMANAAVSQTIRKLAAIWGATDVELKLAESDPSVMALLEAKVADQPFADSFQAAMDFQSALWTSLGVTPASSVPDEPKSQAVAEIETGVPAETQADSPSAS